MNDSQRSSMIDRILKEYDAEKGRRTNTLDGGQSEGRPDVRASLLLAEVLVEIDRCLQVFVYEFQRDKVP